MSNVFLKRLTICDEEPVFQMLQNIGNNENEFKNPVKGMSYIEFKLWLKQQDAWSRGENLPDGYVEQTVFWLYDGIIPVGVGKIRHKLTKSSRAVGGNIGYAISSEFRGKGYGCILLELLLKQTEVMNIKERLLTVEKNNFASKRVVEKNGGRLIKENDNRWYFEF